MSDTTQTKGSCLCGAVSITVNLANKSAGACHCSMCRQWAGGPFIALDCGSDVVIEGEDNISRYNSSDWAERTFCKHCGSNLFYRLKETNQHIVSAGLFNDEQDLIFDHQIFIDEKPAYYEFANQTKNMTGAEVFAAYAPPSTD